MSKYSLTPQIEQVASLMVWNYFLSGTFEARMLGLFPDMKLNSTLLYINLIEL